MGLRHNMEVSNDTSRRVRDADMGGIKLTFNPQNHQGQSNVYLEIVRGIGHGTVHDGG